MHYKFIINIFITLATILSIDGCNKVSKDNKNTNEDDKNTIEIKKIFNFHLRSSDESGFQSLSKVAFSDSIFVVYGSNLYSKVNKIEDTIRNSYRPNIYKKGKLINEFNDQNSKSYYDSIFRDLTIKKLKTLTIQEFKNNAVNYFISTQNDAISNEMIKKFNKEKLKDGTEIQFSINQNYEGVIKIGNKDKTITVSESNPEHFLVLQDITGDAIEELFVGTINYDYQGFRIYYCSIYQVINN